MSPASLHADDQAILDRARDHPLSGQHEIPDENVWRDLAQAEGIDFATAVQYQRLRLHSRHAPFIDAVGATEALLPPPRLPGSIRPTFSRAESPRIVIVPGAFHRQYPHTGADGAMVRRLAREMGWPADRLEVPSLGVMSENAAALASMLRRMPSGPVVLVSLSKGGSDVRAALARPEFADAVAKVHTWLNLSGIVTGTALVAWFRSQPLRYWGIRALLALRRQNFAAIHELRREPDAPLSAPLLLPSHLTAIHVIGFPLERHLSDDWARRGHARLAPLGPNDGGGILLSDCEHLPGHVYPAWGADHYLRPNWITQRLASMAHRSFPNPMA